MRASTNQQLHPTQESGQLVIAWSATSTSVNGVFRGDLEIPLAARPTLFDDIEHDIHDRAPSDRRRHSVR